MLWTANNWLSIVTIAYWQSAAIAFLNTNYPSTESAGLECVCVSVERSGTLLPKNLVELAHFREFAAESSGVPFILGFHV